MEKWNFIKLNKEFALKQEKLEDKSCKHEHWIAKCSHCGKILASDTQNVTEEDIKSKIIC